MDMSIYHIVEKINSDARAVAFSKGKSKAFLVIVGILTLIQVFLLLAVYTK